MRSSAAQCIPVPYLRVFVLTVRGRSFYVHYSRVRELTVLEQSLSERQDKLREVTGALNVLQVL